MAELQEQAFPSTGEVALEETATPGVESRETSESFLESVPQREEVSNTAPAPVGAGASPSNLTPAGTMETPSRHAQAGRKGARRVHQLIQEGRLYEQEHGLKRGRQRLRQLIELGKLYEQEHGLRPGPEKKHGERLSRAGRDELLATLLECLVRIAKPSFRAELQRLVQTLSQDEKGHAV